MHRRSLAHVALRVRLSGGSEDVFSEQRWVEKRLALTGEDLERIPKATRFYFNIEHGDLLMVVKVTVHLESGRWLPDDSELVGCYRSEAWASVRKD